VLPFFFYVTRFVLDDRKWDGIFLNTIDIHHPRWWAPEMIRFLVRRALGLIPTIFLIVTLSFVIIRVAPGGPFASEKQLPPEILASIQQRYHLDEPLPASTCATWATSSGATWAPRTATRISPSTS
jgi:hypothetical protein